MIDERTLLSLMVLDNLKTMYEASLRELGWRIGVDTRVVENIIYDLSRCYMIKVDDNKVMWSVADNPSYLKPWGWRIFHETVLGSTQEFIRGCGLWSMVASELLLMGRGRHGRRWIGNLGGLWVSFRLPALSKTADYVPIAIPVLLIKLLRRSFGVNAVIKWPNDIIYMDKKLAGIIIEAEALRDRIILNIGIGINVNNEPPLPGSISLKKILGRIVPRNSLLSLLTGWLTKLDELVENPEDIRKAYLENLSTLNKKIVAKTFQGSVEGVAVDVNEYGELVVKSEDGEKILDPNSTLELRHLD